MPGFWSRRAWRSRSSFLALASAVGVFVFTLATAGAQGGPPFTLAPLLPASSGAAWTSIHDPFESEECSMCHEHDDLEAPGPVADQSRASCLECHDDPAEGQAHRHAHPQGRCLDCHNPHNSRFPSLLHGPFPQTFYASFSRENYGLCFGCHDSALVEAKTTTSATAFRDATRNLHHLHVDRGERGRSCRACHGTHGGPHNRMVEESVPFGSHDWRLPIGFRATAVGGSCAKTCHLERKYDRRPPRLRKKKR